MTKGPYRTREHSNQRHWLAHVRAQHQSGLNRAEYCRQHKISYHRLTYWHRKLSTPSSKTTLVPIVIERNKKGPVPVQSEPAAIKVTLPNKICIEIGDNFSPATLSKLLVTLESR